MTSWEQKQAQKKRRSDAKKAELDKLVKAVEALISRAVENDAYHPAEMDYLNRARSSLFAVRAGYVKRQRY